MTSRRPQDPRTKKIRDDESPTIAPDPGETVFPGDDPQRVIETADPNATVMPGIEAPKSRATRGGAALKQSDRTWTADSMDAVLGPGGPKAQGPGSGGLAASSLVGAPPAALSTVKKKKGASWLVWTLAFLVLGGIGFGVAWFVMNPPGGGDAAATPDTSATPDAAATADAAATPDAVAEATPDAAAEATADVAAEATADVAAAEVAPDAATDTTAEVAPDATADAAAADATADTTAAGDPLADTTPAVAVVPDAAAPPSAPIARNPAESKRLNDLGFALRKAGDNPGALNAYEQAVKADPESVWARYNYACELALAGRSKDALAELTALYKLGTPEAKKALAAARKDSDFASIKATGQFYRLTNF